MLARRTIVLSPDKAFGKQLVVALKAAGGTVDLHPSLEELGGGELAAALVVVHLDGELAGVAPQVVARLAGDARMIAILPRSNLAAVVEVMQGSDRVAGMLVADELDVRRLSAMATRVIVGDIFGLDKLIPWGTQIHSYLVGDYQEKSLCIAQVSEFAESMGVRRKYRESIEHCLDELLMNALYDAPVDDAGRPIFAEIPTKTRISLRVEQKVVVQYACDGLQFAIAVRDTFGTLERATVFRYLHKCLHSEQQIDRKVGGAGLGLYLITSSATEVYFNVLPRVATEAICTFDLEQPKVQLDGFGFFTERIDAAGRLASGPSRRLPAGTSHPVERRAGSPSTGPRWLIAVLIMAILATLGLAGVVAYPRLIGPQRAAVAIRTVPDGAIIEIEGKYAGSTGGGALVIDQLEIGRSYPVSARLDGYAPRSAVVAPREGGSEVTLELTALPAVVTIDSVPGGAAIEIDGKPAGTAPVTITTLAPSTTVAVALSKPGFTTATTQLDVPKPGKETRLIQPLVMAAELARVRLVTTPPGARVVQNGQLLVGITTPAEVMVEAEKPVRFMLTMDGKVPVAIEQLTPSRGALLVREAELIDGTPVRVSATLDGRATIVGAPSCRGLATPLECVVAPGNYTVEYAAPQSAKITRKIKVGRAPVELKLELGFVEAGKAKLLQLPGSSPVKRAAFEVGPRQIIVVDESGARATTVVVRANATVIAN